MRQTNDLSVLIYSAECSRETIRDYVQITFVVPVMISLFYLLFFFCEFIMLLLFLLLMLLLCNHEVLIIIIIAIFIIQIDPLCVVKYADCSYNTIQIRISL